MARSLLRARLRAGVMGKAADAASEWARGVAKTRGEGSVYARASRAAADLLQSRVDGGADECFRLGMAAWEGGDRYGADRWFLLAAKQGHDGAMCNIGVLCATGWGVPGKEDYASAVKWYTLAANAGNDVGAKNLGKLLLDGTKGVPRNRTEALRWLRIAAERGNADAKAILYDEERNTRGARQGNGAGQNGAGGQERPAHHAKMTRAEALEIFDLKEGATREEIKSAYHRLLQQVHPDKGGSNHFARELNEARDLLLG